MKRLASLLVVFFIMIGSISNSSAETWAEYKQPGNGIISLLGNWAVVNLWKQAEQKGDKNGVKHFFQQLLNAKSAHNGVVCSISSGRTWYAKGKSIVTSEQIKIHDYVSNMMKGIKEALKSDSVSKLSTEKQKYGTVYRFDVVFGNGSSKMLEAYVQRKGFIYRLSAVYSISEDKHWKSVFDEALKWPLCQDKKTLFFKV